MDLLQVALIFLILLLSIFLAITGFQVFLILRDLKKGLDKFNNILKSGENIVEDLERPVSSTKVISGIVQKNSKQAVPRPKRFYKKVL